MPPPQQRARTAQQPPQRQNGVKRQLAQCRQIQHTCRKAVGQILHRASQQQGRGLVHCPKAKQHQQRYRQLQAPVTVAKQRQDRRDGKRRAKQQIADPRDQPHTQLAHLGARAKGHAFAKQRQGLFVLSAHTLGWAVCPQHDAQCHRQLPQHAKADPTHQGRRQGGHLQEAIQLHQRRRARPVGAVSL